MKQKRRLLSLMAASLLVGGLLGGCSSQPITPAAAAAGETLRIMSFNVAGFGGSVLKGTHWSGRVKRLAELLGEKAPDSVGTQEMAKKWLDKLSVLLPAYAAVGVARDDGKEEGEYNSILYRADKYDLTDSGTFWLSKTPESPTKYDEQTGCKRVCTYAVLKNKQTGKSYVHINTHFDNVSAEAREYGAKQVRQKAESYALLPVVITGDFNCGTDETPYRILSAPPFVDTQKAAAKSMAPGSYHEWGAFSSPEGLDYCLVKEGAFQVSSYEVLRSEESYETLSDHYALFIEMTLTGKV